jgi:hypothetical protein
MTSLMSSKRTGITQLFAESIAFRLYVAHSEGLSVKRLAQIYSRPEHWVTERIEAARLCLTKQTRIELSPDPSVCAADVWAAQVWD